jgi:hypothetical protein
MKKSLPARLASRVKKGRLPPSPGLKRANGAAVELGPLPSDPPFLKVILKLAKPRDWPRDFALNHGHYVKGYPKQ